jgi:hypothetical protein
VEVLSERGGTHVQDEKILCYQPVSVTRVNTIIDCSLKTRNDAHTLKYGNSLNLPILKSLQFVPLGFGAAFTTME